MTASPPAGALSDESYARAALTYLAEPADQWLNGLISAHGATRTLAAIRSGRLPGPGGDVPVPQFNRRRLQPGVRTVVFGIIFAAILEILLHSNL